MFSKKTIFVFPIFSILCVLFGFGCNSSNRHSWILPNNEKIEYHEGPIDTPGFQAHPAEYISWTSETRGTNNLALGDNGGFASFQLNLNQNRTLAWLTGRYGGSDKPDYIAVFDLNNFQITDGDCMWGSESNMNFSDIKLKREIEQSRATAIVLPEQK